MNIALNLGALAFAGFATPGFTATATTSASADIEASITAIITHVNVLGSATTSFASQGNGGSLTAALSIYSGAHTLIATINSATDIAKAIPFGSISDDTGLAIFNRFSVLEPLVGQSLEDLKVSKTAFNALLPGPLAALGNPQYIISGTLLALRASFVNFKLAVLAVTPITILDQVRALPERMEATLDAAIAFYSS